METAGEEGGGYVWEQKSLRLQRDLTWEGRGSQKQRPHPHAWVWLEQRRGTWRLGRLEVKEARGRWEVRHGWEVFQIFQCRRYHGGS